MEVPVHGDVNPAAMEGVSHQVFLFDGHGKRRFCFCDRRHGASG